MLTAREEFGRGFTQIVPVLVAVAPFGLVVGVTAAKVGLGAGLGIGSSAFLFAGASQLAAMSLIAEEASILVAIGTALVINLRLLMYSAALRPHLQHRPWPERLVLSHVITDQSFGLSMVELPPEPPPDVRPHRHWFYIGTAFPLFVLWMVSTAIGFFAGAAVPDDWSLEFAAVLVFLSLTISAVVNTPTLIAAVAGATTALLARGLPLSLGLPVGAIVGIAAGMVAERRLR